MTEITAPAPPGWGGRLGLGHKHAHDPDAAVTASLGPTRELRKNYEASLAHARALAQASINRDDSSVAATVSRSTRVLLGCLAAMLAVGLLVSRWIIQLIALPVHRLLSLMSGDRLT